MFKFWLPAVWPWISHFFPLNLSFHPCVMAVNTLCWGSANVHILPPPFRLYGKKWKIWEGLAAKSLWKN